MANNKEVLVKPNPLLLNLLQCAGAEKETFTMAEVIYHLGQYIIAKQLYDEKQQHIVRCSNDPLGELFGVQNFSVKEPRRLHAMISRNLVTAESQDCFLQTLCGNEACMFSQTQNSKQNFAQELQEEIAPPTSMSSPKQAHSQSEDSSSNDQPSEQQRKQHKSDSISLTFDESLSWYVISGLCGNRSNSDSTDTSSNADPDMRPVIGSSDWLHQDSDSDQFSVEFEVESVYSDDYSPGGDEQSLTDDDLDDEVYQVTIYQAEDTDPVSFHDDDDDTDISEAASNLCDQDYWKCSQCSEMNPPIPRYCHRCWAHCKDWLPDQKQTKSHALKRKEMEDSQEDEEHDSPDGKKAKQTDLNDSHILKKEDDVIQSSESQKTEHISLPTTSSSSQGEYRHSEQRQTSEESRLPHPSVEPCVICQTRPKNGCIVHGRTGHLMACFTCARKLKKRNKPCPVCRQPIQMIVLTYFS